MTSRFTLDADLYLALRLADAAREISLARFRGSFQRAIWAPSLIELFNPEAIVLIQFGDDPCASAAEQRATAAHPRSCGAP